MLLHNNFKTIFLFLFVAIFSFSANAALFSDNEARNAILELRQNISKLESRNQLLNKNLLDSQRQFDILQSSIATITGNNEAMQFRIDNLEQSISELNQRIEKLEPKKINIDNIKFTANPGEVNAYKQSMEVFKKGDFNVTSKVLNEFIKNYPNSGYIPTVLFWLGTAEYANNNYQKAINSFQQLINSSPNHKRIAEAMLGIANCQVELKAINNAKKTLNSIIKKYPDSSEASDAQRRLNTL